MRKIVKISPETIGVAFQAMMNVVRDHVAISLTLRYRKRLKFPKRFTRQTVEQHNRASRKVHEFVFSYPDCKPIRISMPSRTKLAPKGS